MPILHAFTDAHFPSLTPLPNPWWEKVGKEHVWTAVFRLFLLLFTLKNSNTTICER